MTYYGLAAPFRCLAAVYELARQPYHCQQCQARGVMWWPAPAPALALLHWPALALLYVILVGGEAQLSPGPLKVGVVIRTRCSCW